MADDLGERTEDATPKRRQEAREEGQVAKSQDLSGALLLLAATIALWMTGAGLLRQAAGLLERTLGGEGFTLHAPADEVLGMAGGLLVGALLLCAPILLVCWSVAAFSQVGQIGWVFAPKAAKPKASKLSPLAGIKRVYGGTAFVKWGVDVLKMLIVGAVAVQAVVSAAAQVVVLPELALIDAVSVVAQLTLGLAMRVLIVLLILGIIDYVHQRYRHEQNLKMSKQQVKEELRMMEGDPETKRRRLRMQQQLSSQRISAAVPKADVIVTNPEHISIAIQYDDATMRAPRVVAKGADFLAFRIRQIAMQHGIPIVERKPLARALYREVAVNQEIPEQFYKAVAEILAFVYRLSGEKRTAGGAAQAAGA